MEKFKKAVKDAVRDKAYAEVAGFQFTDAEYVGRFGEGQVFTTDEGVSFVVRVVVKDVDFDAEYEVADYAEVQEKKAKEKAEAKAKAEKAKAKKVKAEADADAEKEGE